MNHAEELEALTRRMQTYSKLRPYAPPGLEAVIDAVRRRGRALALAARLEAPAACLPRRARAAG